MQIPGVSGHRQGARLAIARFEGVSRREEGPRRQQVSQAVEGQILWHDWLTPTQQRVERVIEDAHQLVIRQRLRRDAGPVEALDQRAGALLKARDRGLVRLGPVLARDHRRIPGDHDIKIPVHQSGAGAKVGEQVRVARGDTLHRRGHTVGFHAQQIAVFCRPHLEHHLDGMGQCMQQLGPCLQDGGLLLLILECDLGRLAVQNLSPLTTA